ncbi:DUF4180 domain-containing protein [Saccharopolyspora sp. NPDC047091]|uniref:DUF4180 domain-containing protein n=1 Tax=Saccharopolyspora sp. NPDC047091 TaxID=3155924 RepID=UPI0033C2A530
MGDVIEERAGVPVLVCDPAGPPVATEQDAVDLIGAAYLGAEAVVVPVDRLAPEFFTLGTGLAGQVLQKFAQYRLPLAVVGDLTEQLTASGALRALVRESDRRDQVWFVPDGAALEARLRALARR